MRVAFLAYYFPPFGGGGVQRSVKFVKHLRGFGYEPVVVTRPLSSTFAWTPPDPTLDADVPPGTEVVRADGPEPARAGGSRARAERWFRLESEFERWWVDGAIRAGRAVEGRVDLVYASMSPFETGDAARILAAELGVPWVADLRDPWALDEWLVYPTRLHRAVELRRMRRLLGAANAVVMNTPEATAEVLRRFPELRGKPVVTITNGFDAHDFAGAPPARADDAFRIVHAGNVFPVPDRAHLRLGRRILGGSVPGLNVVTRSHVHLLDAVAAVRAELPAAGRRIEVHLAGSIDERVRETLPPWVVAHGYLSHPETVALLRSADLLFLPMHDLPPGVRARIVPGKTYEYLAAERPILAAVPDGDAKDLLAEAGNAFLCRPPDADEMARIIAERLQSAGDRDALRPRPEVLARYERRRLTGLLADAFDAALGRGAGASPRNARRVG
ncbi:MAG TPA: glycosyltransferase [Gaiellaceae bacterium]|jgi:glycosyltransferase involved in cell wall biosynthesis|nr:glycosyltransferase [Gaiellaceae bacterium]